MIFLDTEGVGKTGPLVLIQWSGNDDTNIRVHHVWQESVRSTLELIEYICVESVCGFNLVHDWFTITKWFNIFRRASNLNEPPSLDEIRSLEKEGPRSDDQCLRPSAAIDLMLLARTGKFQYLAKHKHVLIKKVPRVAVHTVLGELERILLPEGVGIRWRESEKRQQRADVVDIVGEFTNLSTSLKSLASIILGRPEIKERTFEKEVGKIPYEEAPDWRPWGGEWIRGLNFLRRAFEEQRAIDYAVSDIHYTYQLWKALGSPAGGDDDSELACLVGGTQWRGFSIASTAVLTEKLLQCIEDRKAGPTAPAAVHDYLSSFLNPIERLVLKDTKRQTLEELARWEGDTPGSRHPVAAAVANVQKARRAMKREDILRKLIAAKRFYFSQKVIGTLSSRTAGGSEVGSSESTAREGKTRLNPQGIPREKSFRTLFTLSDAATEHTEGGDFDGLEVTIACAVDGDDQLVADYKHSLESGLGFHSITGSTIYSLTPEEVKKTKGTLDDLYTRSKNCFFGWRYGAQLYKFAQTANLSEDVARLSWTRLKHRYSKIAQRMQATARRFTPLQQPNGPGTAIEWTEPDEYVESILGFRRYFTLEWSIIRALFSMANASSELFGGFKGTVRRTNREQTINGAISSALYAGIFSLQGHVFRAAANHEIQSVGAQCTKRLQRRIWDLQPVGIGPWQVCPFNIHDEVMCICRTEAISSSMVSNRVAETLSSLRTQIPLLSMEWKTNLKNWGEK